MIDVTHLYHGRTRGGYEVVSVEETPATKKGKTLRATIKICGETQFHDHHSDGQYNRHFNCYLDLILIDQTHPLDEPQPAATAPAPTPEPGPRVVRFDGPSGPVYIRADRVSAIGQSDVSKSVTWVSLGDKRSDPRGDGDGAEMFWIIGTPDRVAAALWPNTVVVEGCK